MEIKLQLTEYDTIISSVPFNPGAYLTAAEQKARLYSAGKPIEDYDLLIGCTALYRQRVLLTGNVKHMSSIEGLKIESI